MTDAHNNISSISKDSDHISGRFVRVFTMATRRQGHSNRRKIWYRTREMNLYIFFCFLKAYDE